MGCVGLDGVEAVEERGGLSKLVVRNITQLWLRFYNAHR